MENLFHCRSTFILNSHDQKSIRTRPVYWYFTLAKKLKTGYPVESCTGGSLSKLVTDIPGASEWFDCGLVTYSNESKTKLAGVPEELIRQQGAVSQKVALALAKGLSDATQG